MCSGKLGPFRFGVGPIVVVVEGVSDGLGADRIREDVVHVFGGLSSMRCNFSRGKTMRKQRDDIAFISSGDRFHDRMRGIEVDALCYIL